MEGGRSRRWIILAHMFSVFSLHAKDWLVPGLHVGSSKYKGYASTMSTAFTRKNPTWNATIPDKTTWESFPHHVHFPTQQNYFLINEEQHCLGERENICCSCVVLHKWLTNQKENVCHYVSVLHEKPKKIIASFCNLVARSNFLGNVLAQSLSLS